MSALNPNPRPLLGKSTESRRQTSEFTNASLRKDLVTTVAGFVLAQITAPTGSNLPKKDEQTSRLELLKLEDLAFRLNMVYISFLMCFPESIVPATLRIGTIVDALDRVIYILDNCKSEISNLIKNIDAPDPSANLQNLETVLTKELLTIFNRINETNIDPEDKPQTEYFKILVDKLGFLGVNSKMTEEDLKALATPQVINKNPTRFGELIVKIDNHLNPGQKI